MKLSWRGVNLLFLICTSINFTADGHVTAFTPLVLQELGLAPGEVAVWTGLLSAVTTSMAFPLAPFWGVLAERLSRRKIVLRSYYLMALAVLVTAWAPSVPFLILGRILHGFSYGTMGVVISVQAMLTPRPKIGTAIATVQAAQPVAASLGPPLGALVIPIIGLRGLFLADAAVVLMAALALTLLMPEPAGRRSQGSVLARTREVLGLVWTIEPIRWNFAGAFLLRGATSVVDSYLPVRIAQLAPGDPAPAIGWILGVYGALSTLATWLAGRLIDRYEETRLFWRAMLFGGVLTFGLATAPWLWLVGVLSALRAIPVALSNTVLFAHKARVLPAELQTPIMSLSPVPRNAGGLVFPLLAAAVVSVFPAGALLVGAASYVGSGLAGLQLERATRRFRIGQRRAAAPETA